MLDRSTPNLFSAEPQPACAAADQPTLPRLPGHRLRSGQRQRTGLGGFAALRSRKRAASKTALAWRRSVRRRLPVVVVLGVVALHLLASTNRASHAHVSPVAVPSTPSIRSRASGSAAKAPTRSPIRVVGHRVPVRMHASARSAPSRWHPPPRPRALIAHRVPAHPAGAPPPPQPPRVARRAERVNPVAREFGFER